VLGLKPFHYEQSVKRNVAVGPTIALMRIDQSAKNMSLNRRLAKIEKTLADRRKIEELASCICGGVAIIGLCEGDEEEFEIEKNLPCPIHRIRQYDRVITFRLVDPDPEVSSDSMPESKNQIGPGQPI
jgi:hypothetical protein